MSFPEIVTPRLLLREWLATEGGAAALDFGSREKGLRRFISIAHRDNAASQRVMQKLDLVHEGEAEWHESPVVWFALER